MCGDLAGLGGTLDASSLDVPGLDFLGHSNDANRPFFWLHLNSFIQTHDRFLEYMQKGRFPGWNSRTRTIPNNWKHVPSL